jgi:hypothetical protein
MTAKPKEKEGKNFDASSLLAAAPSLPLQTVIQRRVETG